MQLCVRPRSHEQESALLKAALLGTALGVGLRGKSRVCPA